MEDTDFGTVETRAGYVALAGRPNVGKSTLLNAFVGEKLSIVTPRAQTTRDRVTGIYTDDEVQLIFVDTPGLLEPRYLLQQSMLEAALSALADSDLALLVLDATDPEDTLPGEPGLAALERKGEALLVAINKVDAAAGEAVEGLRRWTVETLGKDPFEVSALRGTGLESLRAALTSTMPRSPFLYSPEDLAVQPVRFFVAELVRETIFEEYQQEVPYAAVVRIEEFRESEDPIFIRATVIVERESQKAIIIGKRGAGVKNLGQRSRAKIEDFLGERVYLDLWVKSMAGWRKKPGSLRHLGYPVPKSRGDAS